MKLNFDFNAVRAQFPALDRKVNGNACIYLDGPGGSQVPQRVADKIAEYLLYHNANAHGCYITSVETGDLLDNGRKVFADFFGCAKDEVSFGESSSGNNFKLALGLARDLKPGDEVIITDIDHEGSRSPWKLLEEFGAVVKSVKLNLKEFTLDFDDYKDKLTAKTRIVAINWASNATGTITDVKKYIDLAHAVGAITIVDAVHYAPHRPMDVKAIGTDFLVCSAYKFFGPHLGVIYTKKDVVSKIRTIRVNAYDNAEPPEKFETGTPNFESICGAAEAVEFIADIGKNYVDHYADELKAVSGRRKNIIAGMRAFEDYEDEMSLVLKNGLLAIPGVTVYCPPEGMPKTSTVSFTIQGKNSLDVAKFLAEKGIFVWDGDFYAIELVNNNLKLADQGGLVRLGLEPYITMEEIHRTIDAVRKYCSI